jgi:hypothetical protein
MARVVLGDATGLADDTVAVNSAPDPRFVLLGERCFRMTAMGVASVIDYRARVTGSQEVLHEELHKSRPATEDDFLSDSLARYSGRGIG